MLSDATWQVFEAEPCTCLQPDWGTTQQLRDAFMQPARDSPPRGVVGSRPGQADQPLRSPAQVTNIPSPLQGSTPLQVKKARSKGYFYDSHKVSKPDAKMRPTEIRLGCSAG